MRDAAPLPITSGFLIVKRFDVLYRAFAADPKFTLAIYALPLVGTGEERLIVKYHGLDRNAIDPWDGDGALLAQLRMAELQRDILAEPASHQDGQAFRYVGFEDFLRSDRDALDVLRWAEEEAPDEHEIVWTRLAGTPDPPPLAYRLLGYEPTYFLSDHFSAICDCMCFPRWHGTDPEGALFLSYFQRLNAKGLFDEPDVAAAFLSFYRSFEWTEKGDYYIAEVWSPVVGAVTAKVP